MDSPSEEKETKEKKMKNFGFQPEEKFYSEQDFKDGCWFNFILGCVTGVFAIAAVQLVFLWSRGWIG